MIERTDLTRRGVLAGTAVAVMAGVVARAGTPVATARERFTRDGSLYARRRWTRARGRRFEVSGDGFTARGRLTAVTQLANGSRRADRNFMLTFEFTGRGPAQGTYTVRGSRFAATSLFLVPTDESRRTTRAVVYRAR